MLITEFIDRTGYRPTDREYHSVIEPAYYVYPHDKDSFCHQWLLKRLSVCREYIAGFEKRMKMAKNCRIWQYMAILLLAKCSPYSPKN